MNKRGWHKLEYELEGLGLILKRQLCRPLWMRMFNGYGLKVHKQKPVLSVRHRGGEPTLSRSISNMAKQNNFLFFAGTWSGHGER